MFDWKESTLNDCAWHIARSTPQATNTMIAYYRKKDDNEVVDKILEARKLAKKYRTLIKAERITEELLEKGNTNAIDSILHGKELDKRTQ